MSLKFKDSTGTIHSMGGSGGGISASQLETLYPLLAKLYVDQEGDLIFGSKKVTISDELSANDQAIADMVDNENSGHDPDYVPDENDEAINNMFNNDTPSGDNNENEFDDLFNSEDSSSSDDTENEFDDMFTFSDDTSSSEENEFDDMFNDNSESDTNDETINSWFEGDSTGENSDETNEFDDMFSENGSDSSDESSNEFDDLFNS